MVNEIFVHLPRPVIDHLNAAGFSVAESELDETAPPRFVTAWNTEMTDVNRLLAAVGEAVS